MGLMEVKEGEGVLSVVGEWEMVVNFKYSGCVFIKFILGCFDGGVGFIG